MESLFQENDQVGRYGVPLPRELSSGQRWNPSSRRTIRWAEMDSLFQVNDQVGRDAVPLQGKWAEIEPLFQENDHLSRGGVPLPGE
jgi:hypothetical protein